MLVPARWCQPTDRGKVQCTLCPRFCRIGKGQDGYCLVRRNVDGKLFFTAYGQADGLHFDPIEKKPLNHFLPGSSILSFGTVGCNLGCKFCQNWHMSRAKVEDHRAVDISPEEIVNLAISRNCPSIAYTYNEPTIFAEYLVDTAKLARQEGLRNVMVTNGYITPEARKDVYENIDAANVDLKALDAEFYRRMTSTHLQYVLETIKWLVNETEVWVEITNLLIPGFNDADDQIDGLVNWILNNCGDRVPLHFSAFYPSYRLINTPPTPLKTVLKARKTALDKGIKYVYVGNVSVSNEQNTFCSECGRTVINRYRMGYAGTNLMDGKCTCGAKIDGVFT